MTIYLLDTNILLRMSDTNSSVHLLASQATAKVLSQENEVCITSQNIIEFWAVATRPIMANGLGWSPQKTQAEVEQIQTQFPLLQDMPEVFGHWLTYVINH